MTRLLDIGVTGLTTHQRALATTGHNISNAGVEGYSRQEVEFNTLPPQYRNGNFVGSGVGIETIRRITDELVTRQSFTDISRVNELEVLSAGVAQIDTMLAGENTGLNTALNALFASLQSVSEAPTSTTLRAQVLNDAQRFIERYDAVYRQIQGVVDQTNGMMQSEIESVNALARSIAQINLQIKSATAGQSIDKPNDLLDRRDRLLSQLAEKISFSITESEEMISVFIGGGQPLVLGDKSNLISSVGNAASGEGLDVAITINGQPRIITERLNGGSIGGILALRNSVLDQSFNQLGLVQNLLSHSINTLHKEGVDLNGIAGGNLFTDINDPQLQLARVRAVAGNPSTDSVVGVTLDDPAALTGSDYLLELSTTGIFTSYTVTRRSDGVLVGEGALAPSFPQSLTVADGFTINLESGNFQAGDRYVLSPSRVRAGSVDLLIKDPSALALALPVATSAAQGNIGSGVISQVDALDVSNINPAQAQLIAQQRALTPPLLIQFTSATTYDVLDNSDPAQPVQLVPPLRNQVFIPGQINSILNFDLNATATTSSPLFTSGATSGPIGTQDNGYPGETITITYTDPTTGALTTQNAVALAGEPASVVAARLDSLDGVSATANTELTLQLSDDGLLPPLQMRLNGVELTDPGLGAVPSPVTADFIAQRVNQVFAGSGIVASSNGGTLALRSLSGEDLTLENISAGADSFSISSVNGNTLGVPVSVAAGQESVIGGTIDAVVNEAYGGSSTGGHFGGAGLFALPAFTGYSTNLSGQPQAGDSFYINTSTSASGDNRNALALAGLQSADITRDGRNMDDIYAGLVGDVGNKAASARIDKEAAQSILAQTQDRLSSISGVNLDEEAAKLLQYEQVYNASARIISVARSIFDSLLSAFA